MLKGFRMTQSAKDIAAERYAKGEITKDQYSEILSDLEKQSSPEAQQDQTEVSNSHQDSNSFELANLLNWKTAAALFVGFFLIQFFRASSGADATGLNFTLEDIRTNSTRTEIKLILANSSNKAADVTIWRKVGTDEDCERVFRVKARTRHSLTIQCAPSSAKRIEVGIAWSDTAPARTNVARRVQ